jgi:RimJ/RimL family protein N-acetyltransferase
LPATAKDGTVSRIQAAFEPGAGVVTSRGDVQYVVTEFGIADLWGKNIRQRAMSLIEIAHPDFRAELLAAAKERRYVFSDQVVPRGRVPWEETGQATLGSGEEVTVRPLLMSDEEPLQDLFYRLSNESTYTRFMAFKKAHPHEEMQALVNLDYESTMALVVTRHEGADEDIVAMSRYDVDPATRLADIAFVVRDEWQNKGVGTLLMRRMLEFARERGLAGFTGDVLVTNKAMMTVFQKSGLNVRMERDGDAYRLMAYIDDSAPTERPSQP